MLESNLYFILFLVLGSSLSLVFFWDMDQKALPENRLGFPASFFLSTIFGFFIGYICLISLGMSVISRQWDKPAS